MVDLCLRKWVRKRPWARQRMRGLTGDCFSLCCCFVRYRQEGNEDWGFFLSLFPTVTIVSIMTKSEMKFKGRNVLHEFLHKVIRGGESGQNQTSAGPQLQKGTAGWSVPRKLQIFSWGHIRRGGKTKEEDPLCLWSASGYCGPATLLSSPFVFNTITCQDAKLIMLPG